MAFSVYILYSRSTQNFYKGQTQNLSERLKRHNAGWENFTREGRPWILLWSAQKSTRSEAMVLEGKIKNLSRKRLIRFMLKYFREVAGPDEMELLKQLDACFDDQRG
jgi:putative endonuclease